MNISKAIFRHEALGDQRRRVCSKKHALSLPKGPSSLVLRLLEGPVLRLLEGKATAIFARGTYWHYVGTKQGRERRWRLFSIDPTCNAVSSARESRTFDLARETARTPKKRRRP